MQMIPNKVYTPRGYSIAKTAVNPQQKALIEKELTVCAVVLPLYIGTVAPFKIWIESPARYYLPQAWGRSKFGIAEADIRPEGSTLPASLKFQGTLRPHQVDALTAFRAAGDSGIICLPCGYGKTFTGIAAASTNTETANTSFIIVVHKEFLADQWTSELRALLPGIRIGRIQGEKCEIGPTIDVAIAMIQTICSRTYPVGTFSQFGLAIFDEVHHLGAEHFSQALQRIQCKRMLGLTATPKRTDGLSKVFEWNIGPIVYQITSRPKDDTVLVECLRYECDDADYADVPKDWKGNTVRAKMINQIAQYTPRTNAILDWISPMMAEEGRKLLILSDRRGHLTQLEGGFRSRGISSIGYYVGGMKQKDLDISASCSVILGTFAMASEGMNIPTLNMMLLGTPKSNIEQSVGRILRLKKEERTVQPRILDVLDSAFVECIGQWNRRRKFYKECGYSIKFAGELDAEPVKVSLPEERGKCIILDD